MVFVKDIDFKLDSTDIHPNSEIKGTIIVSYPGRYDGVLINVQIFDSNEHIIYKSYNGKNISQNVSRLFINKDVMPENKAEFTASINFEPTVSPANISSSSRKRRMDFETVCQLVSIPPSQR